MLIELAQSEFLLKLVYKHYIALSISNTKIRVVVAFSAPNILS